MVIIGIMTSILSVIVVNIKNMVM